ncbi:MAG: hypothetical protein AAGJ31_09495, partial [Verrucomicrobiota bacterium]
MTQFFQSLRIPAFLLILLLAFSGCANFPDEVSQQSSSDFEGSASFRKFSQQAFSNMQAAASRLESGKKEPADYFQLSSEMIGKNQFLVRTTAYCDAENEAGGKYGNKTALGTVLRGSGKMRSAAADWSRYPLGTRFRIVGSPQIYEIDDYGSALVGTDTLDIYQPTLR